MKDIVVLYTKFDQELSSKDWQRYLKLLPADQFERNGRYYQWQDRQAHLLGRLLVQHGWQMFGLESNPLECLKYNSYGRPFINEMVDFNISHSGNYVICAIGVKVKLGIDIEQHNEIELKYFTNTMNAAQWADIYNTPVPVRAFLRYWTMKEAAVKADGRGLSIPLKSILLEGKTACIENSFWHIHELAIDPCYHAYLACNTTEVNVHVEACYF